MKLTLTEVSKKHNIGHRTLRKACNEGRLKGEKLGRDWFVTKKQVEKYLEGFSPKPRKEK